MFCSTPVVVPYHFGAGIEGGGRFSGTRERRAVQKVEFCSGRARPTAALAQIKPVRAIQTSAGLLRSAIVGLAGAYQSIGDDNGTKAAAALVISAGDRVDKFCPGATP